MAKITSESIANLKALFQDNEKALGSNFSQLIDFFNDNKVTDNGDGTFSVGAITVDASKLYNLINNSSPNILPLDNEFTGKNTFDIAPINKANGKPYITEDSVPPVDLSNYTTKDQLATKADTSAIDPSVMVKRTLTANDDILSLDNGTYSANGVSPKNWPPAASNYGKVVVSSRVGGTTKFVDIYDINYNHFQNILASSAGSGWGPWKALVLDNGNGTITVNGAKMVPANDTYTVKHNDAGKLQGKLDSNYGDLTVDGAPLMGGTISASQADAVAQSKADLAAGKLVLRWFSDGTS